MMIPHIRQQQHPPRTPTKRCSFATKAHREEVSSQGTGRTRGNVFSQQQQQEDTVPQFSNVSIIDFDATRIHEYGQSPQHLEQLVEQLEQMESLTISDMQPLIRPLVQACKLLRDKERAADLAERILFNCLARIPSNVSERFEECRSDDLNRSTSLPYPDQSMYTTVMSIVGSLRTEESANRVNRLLRLMMAEHRTELLYLEQVGKDPDDYFVRAAKPNLGTLKALLRAWAVSQTATGAKEAENVLVEMEELSGMRSSDGVGSSGGLSSDPTKNNDGKRYTIRPPDVECYNMVLSAYSRVPAERHPRVTDRARALFRRMQHLEEHGDNFKLEWFSYHSFLKCVEKAIRASKHELDGSFIADLESIIPALSTLEIPDSFLKMYEDQGVHPRASAFGIVVAAILHQTSSEIRIKQADNLMRQMVGEMPFSHASAQGVPLPQLWPSQETFVAVAKAWRHGQLREADRALERIESLASHSSYLSLNHFHLAMKTWKDSREPMAPRIVQAFLDRIWDPLSNHVATGETIALAMHTWVNSTEDESARRVEGILSEAISKYQETKSYILNETHLDLTLKAWQGLCKAGKRYEGTYGLLYPAEHARSHLDNLQASAVWDPRNYRHYSTCLKAWVYQVLVPTDDETLPAREAASLLENLEKHSCEQAPAPHCNMVMQACVRDDISNSQKPEVYSIAMKTFNNGSHDPYSYILAVEIVKRYANELRDDHLQFISDIVQTCRDSGQLTQTLMYEAIEVLGKEELKRLFHFTDSYADMILKERSTKLRRKGKKLQWKDRQTPRGLQVANLPVSWSQNTEIRNGRTEKL